MALERPSVLAFHLRRRVIDARKQCPQELFNAPLSSLHRSFAAIAASDEYRERLDFSNGASGEDLDETFRTSQSLPCRLPVALARAFQMPGEFFGGNCPDMRVVLIVQTFCNDSRGLGPRNEDAGNMLVRVTYSFAHEPGRIHVFTYLKVSGVIKSFSTASSKALQMVVSGSCTAARNSPKYATSSLTRT